MGKVIVFANQKGGVGKTTTTVSVGAYLAEAGKRVLLVDFDPQGNLSSHVGVSVREEGNIYSSLLGGVSSLQCLKKTSVENLFIIASSIHLAGAAVELVNSEGREFYLKRALEAVIEMFDYILIDCPPSLGLLTINGFAASHAVIVPLQCEFFSLEGFLSMLFGTIKRVQRQLNQQLKIGGVVFTMYDSRTKLSHEVIQQVRTSFKSHEGLLFRTVIPRNVRLSEAPSHRVPINLYDRDCPGARCYKKLTDEVIARV